MHEPKDLSLAVAALTSGEPRAAAWLNRVRERLGRPDLESWQVPETLLISLQRQLEKQAANPATLPPSMRRPLDQVNLLVELVELHLDDVWTALYREGVN